MRDSEALNLQQVLEEEARALRIQRANSSTNGQAPLAHGPVGLALSGGGIRSATFSLGVLQALAAEKKLASFDYMSTVSGGGYIGSWLTAWIHRAGLASVQAKLGEFGSAEKHGAPSACEPPEVTWLRRYSNYLTPRVGFLTLDSLTVIATWSRNLVLNLLVLLCSLAVLFMAPHFLVDVFERAGVVHEAFGFGAAWVGLLFFLGIGYNLWHQGLPLQRRRNWLISTRGVVATVIFPGVLASSFAAVWLVNGRKTFAMALEVSAFVAALLCLLLVVWAVAEGVKRRSFNVVKELPVYVLATLVSIGACAGVVAAFHQAWFTLLSDDQTFRNVCVVAFGPPALLAAFATGTTVFTGLVGRIFFERSREWWSRLNAWLFSLGIGWAVLGSLTFFALPTMEWLSLKLGAWMSVLGTGWIGSLLASIFLRKPDTGSKSFQIRIDDALNVAAAVFVAGLLFVVAAGTQWVLLAGGGALVEPSLSLARPSAATLEIHGADRALAYEVRTPEQRETSIADMTSAHVQGLRILHAKEDLLKGLSAFDMTTLAFLGVALLFGWRVDINKFSLHNMYKNRLVRCYLGASNQATRNEQPFTGLDDADDIPLRDLAIGTAADQSPQRPFHLVNTALNITQGANLAWQERKAASFMFSPLHCGYALARTQGDSTSIETAAGWDMPGYRPTQGYAARDREEKGFKLGMALSTSGAAVSPNMGHASSPARAFVLTMFNVRLGRWSSNPAGAAWRRPSPRFGLVALLQELLGYSNERRNYVYLSDGGHFDNLGVYELVRRRCSVIFAVDAGADPTRTFGDLADTIRKCRVDMGVDVYFPELPLLSGNDEMRAAQGFTRGVIRYDPSDPSTDGTLILIKPSMTRALLEPIDVQNYASENRLFPQQTTADQFFDESQFESYRRLGAFIGAHCLVAHGALLPNREPAPKKPDQLPSPELPAAATRLVGFVRSIFKGPIELPNRAGALLDFFVVLCVSTVAFGLAFQFLDPVLVGTKGGFCFSATACSEQLERMFAAEHEISSWRSGLLLRTMIDNVFILVYALTFVCGFIAATQSISDPRLRNRCRFLVCLAPVATACVDYAENFMILGTFGTASDARVNASVIAPLTAWKFILFASCFGLLLALSGIIGRRFKSRWSVTPGGVPRLRA
jgi:hypothetical protein